jgi:hypothetical protein
VVLREESSEEAFVLTVDLPEGELAAMQRIPGAKLVPAGSDTLKSPG